MSRTIIQKYRRLLAEEQGEVQTRREGDLKIALVYPNVYGVGMSNLGFQSVYRLLNARDGVVCHRAFLPDRDEMEEYRRTGTPLLTLETQRPLTDYDVVAFSVSFERDYLNLPMVLQLAGLAPLACDRDSSSPLVMAGGAAIFLNPEPVADFLDVAVIGEAEPVLQDLLSTLLDPPEERDALLCLLAREKALYVPALYDVVSRGDGTVTRQPHGDVPAVVERVWMGPLDEVSTESVLYTPETEFGDMYLLEISRGCPRGCRFCAAGYMYLPYRRRSVETLERLAEEGLSRRNRVGLVGAAISDYPEIGRLCRHILNKGGKVSVSSLRIDGLDDGMIDVLKESGHKTVALAPEGGSQRLRDLVKKNITEEQILDACALLIDRDMLNLKLYFIIGLPTETEEDLEEMMALVTKIRERVLAHAKEKGRIGEIVISVNPFIPKPFTPFQWCGMDSQKSLERKEKLLRKFVARLPNVRLIMESPREAMLQALLSRGDRTLSSFLLDAAEQGWKGALKRLQPSAEERVTRNLPLDAELPWDFIGGVSRTRLIDEYRAALSVAEVPA